MTPGPGTAPPAADGVRHVVVLMLENRSFDHMLGLLDHPSPDFPRIRVDSDEFANPVDPTKMRSAEVRVTADAAYALPAEPPHSHESVMEQLDVRFGRPRMDGFVAAYRRRVLDPDRDRPVIHWFRVAAVGTLAVLVGAAVLAFCASRSFVLTWLGLWLLLALGAAALHRKRSVLPLGLGDLLAVALAVTFGLAALAAAVAEQWSGWWAFGALLAVLVGGGGAVLVLGRRKALRPPPPAPGTEPGAPIMRCMEPMERLPALATLATHFAVATDWHCSVPGATWPNRNFAHAGTSDGTVDIEVGFYEDDTVFDRLEDHGRSWHVYHDGIAQVIAFRRLWDDDRIANWYCFDDFARHVASDSLPDYSFIEPCHGGPRSNSQHPGNNDFDSAPTAPGATSDFERGDALIASIYETLRGRPDVFEKTVFLVTYDEHGGLYDHVPPARARSPRPLGNPDRPPLSVRIVSFFREQPSSRFRFHRYGPRVPAVLVSPRIAPTVDATRYDHTSIAATLRAWFAPDAPPLSQREAHAATFAHLVTDTVRTDLPDLSALHRAPVPGAPVTQPPAGAAAAAPSAAPRTDDFARQLDALAVHVDRRLDARASGTPAPEPVFAGEPGIVAGEGTVDTERVASRFAHRASTTRAGRVP
jgi:phospholipase C